MATRRLVPREGDRQDHPRLTLMLMLLRPSRCCSFDNFRRCKMRRLRSRTQRSQPRKHHPPPQRSLLGALTHFTSNPERERHPKVVADSATIRPAARARATMKAARCAAAARRTAGRRAGPRERHGHKAEQRKPQRKVLVPPVRAQARGPSARNLELMMDRPMAICPAARAASRRTGDGRVAAGPPRERHGRKAEEKKPRRAVLEPQVRAQA